MKRNVLATLIATIILFVWQSLSWVVFSLHDDAYKYSPQQGEIISVLNSNLPEEGAYAIPGTKPGTSYKDMEEESKLHMGKPWAVIFYHNTFEGMSTSNMITGILLNLVAAMIAVSLLHMGSAYQKTFLIRMISVMLLPLFCIFQSILQNWNWWSFPWHFIKGDIMDLIIGWGLCAIFLAWYFGKPVKVKV